MKILIASGNPHKTGELRALLGEIVDAEILDLTMLPVRPPEPDEDGGTLEENAYIKAREIYDAVGIPVIADDTGLEVAALGGAPGVRSARYAGQNVTYADNCRHLLTELAAIPGADRSARFRTVICYVDGYRTLFAEGSVEGSILEGSRGEGGFGYDPLFQPDGSGKTFAEMTSEEKNRISHRGRALVDLRNRLAPFIADACLEGADG